MTDEMISIPPPTSTPPPRAYKIRNSVFSDPLGHTKSGMLGFNYTSPVMVNLIVVSSAVNVDRNLQVLLSLLQVLSSLLQSILES